MNIETLKTLTILYVEDEKELQFEIKNNLSPFVKEIITANNGIEGLEFFKEKYESIDLIITDILMPVMDGVEMVTNIREVDYEIPVIYTTAFSSNEYLQKTINQNIDAYVTKPIDIENLLLIIDKVSLKVDNKNIKDVLVDTNKSLEEELIKKNDELLSLNEKLELKNRKLKTQLYVDDLTGLPNRNELSRDLKFAPNPLVAIIDIDAFGNINDLYGTQIGNFVLKEVANVLCSFEKEMDIRVYRVGSDEFVLLKRDFEDTCKCEESIKKIILTLNKNPLGAGDEHLDIYIDVTVGVSSQGAEKCLETADMALKKAKKNKLSFLFYSDEDDLEKEYKEDIKWTKAIKKAIESDNIVPYYQGIVDRQGNLVKHESLMRLEDNGKAFSPIYFLDIAKKVKFYSSLTKRMIEKSFKKAQEYKSPISVNLAIQDIVDNEMVNFIKTKLVEFDVARFIIFELTESENIQDYEIIHRFILIVKELGAKVAVDDFGSGYSNFSHLLGLEPDYIKIDGSLIKDIVTNKNSFIIAKTIVEFAKELKIKTIAEYVHSEEVFDILKKIGVDEFQGFHFHEPIKEI